MFRNEAAKLGIRQARGLFAVEQPVVILSLCRVYMKQ